MAGGWSHKRLIREIVLTKAYPSTSWTFKPSAGDPAKEWAAKAQKIDPQNKLFWHMPVKRLEAECIRDAVLAATGSLITAPKHVSVLHDMGWSSFSGNNIRGSAGRIRASFRNSKHRSIYLPVLRSMQPDVFTTFDFPQPTMSVGQRDVTTVPSQSLFLMNNPLLIESSQTLADMVIEMRHEKQEDRVVEAYRRILSRSPRPREIERATADIEALKQVTGADVAENAKERRALATWVHALFLTTEFRDLY